MPLRHRHRGRPRRPVLLVAAIAVPLVVVGGAGAVLAAAGNQPPADPDPNCTLVVPADPLSAQGLATPYQLRATDRRKGACHEANPDQAAFVEASVLDPATGAVSVFHPLVVDAGREPAITSAAPKLPAGAVVGIWFGYNGDTLTLRGAPAAAHCVNGLGGSLFGQFAYCNAVAFFQAANAAITAKKLTVPAAQTGRDGKPCPTVRDFAVVDQDQSDNVISSYLVLRDGRTAPNTAANRARLGGRATVLTNGSDNGLVDNFVDPALGCTPWTAPDLADPGAMVSSVALNELAAAAWTKQPVALVPTNDPMTLVNDRSSVAKTNLYRAGVNQPALAAGTFTGRSYCRNMVATALPRLRLDRRLLRAAPSPDPAAAPNLFVFLVQRLRSSFDLLGCANLLHVRNPVPVVNAAALDAANDPAAVAPPAAPEPTPSQQHN
jgi:hypothetical protein